MNRLLRAGLAALLFGLSATAAQAHKASDAYLQLAPAADGGTRLRVDVALRDLDAAVDLDADADGRLTWGEVRTAWPAIDGYVRGHVQIDGCRFEPPEPALERRADGVYAVLDYRAACRWSASAPVRYTLFDGLDPTHRGLLSVRDASGAATAVRPLDPQRPDSAAPPAFGATPAEAGPTTASAGFVREGVHHIVTGYDHVLFLMCLLLPAVLRRTPQGWRPVERFGQALWPVVAIVTAFTLAHSITLALAALKLASLPPGFIEPAIAATIVVAALDNVVPLFRGRRALVTFLFGLIHGFGFAGVLAELDLPAAHFAWALLQFNLGLELGQLAIVAIAIGLLYAARTRRAYVPVVVLGGSAVAILIGAAWFVERVTGGAWMPF
ncbi:HupE/UreJ family protein [Piscinibacter sakaiensis]|uniref:HupE/UreJ family protein n=1 Tax=Piscinibacter sakaiensis TaxID=1547922 RepID=A0A0K8P5J0_PISS1|nr:HupE/UreJ family protein [Piscinibacter sakaiensis]GAP37978.1 hypothetical protein ISF6_4172 [Piscinibacter sakaiensis]